MSRLIQAPPKKRAKPRKRKVESHMDRYDERVLYEAGRRAAREGIYARSSRKFWHPAFLRGWDEVREELKDEEAERTGD